MSIPGCKLPILDPLLIWGPTDYYPPAWPLPPGQYVYIVNHIAYCISIKKTSGLIRPSRYVSDIKRLMILKTQACPSSHALSRPAYRGLSKWALSFYKV